MSNDFVEYRGGKGGGGISEKKAKQIIEAEFKKLAESMKE